MTSVPLQRVPSRNPAVGGPVNRDSNSQHLGLPPGQAKVTLASPRIPARAGARDATRMAASPHKLRRRQRRQLRRSNDILVPPPA